MITILCHQILSPYATEKMLCAFVFQLFFILSVLQLYTQVIQLTHIFTFIQSGFPDLQKNMIFENIFIWYTRKTSYLCSVLMTFYFCFIAWKWTYFWKQINSRPSAEHWNTSRWPGLKQIYYFVESMIKTKDTRQKKSKFHGGLFCKSTREHGLKLIKS